MHHRIRLGRGLGRHRWTALRGPASKVDGQSNAITTVLELRSMLVLGGRILTMAPHGLSGTECTDPPRSEVDHILA